MTTKQNNLLELAKKLNVNILNIEDYQNKDSVIKCTCLSHGHEIEGTVDFLLKTNFECLECKYLEAIDIKDKAPFFLALDAATYVTGMSIFNRQGQLLGHKTFSIDKKKDYFDRVFELKQEIDSIIKKNNIQCVIIEDCQYQNNAALYKKLCMMQGIIRYSIINDHKIDIITAYPDEWRSFNHIYGTKRAEQKKAAIARAAAIFKTDIPEDESESIFLGYYGIDRFNSGNIEEE